MSQTKGKIDAQVGVYAENDSSSPALPKRKNKDTVPSQELYVNQSEATSAVVPPPKSKPKKINTDAVVPLYYNQGAGNEGNDFDDRPESYMSPVAGQDPNVPIPEPDTPSSAPAEAPALPPSITGFYNLPVNDSVNNNNNDNVPHNKPPVSPNRQYLTVIDDGLTPGSSEEDVKLPLQTKGRSFNSSQGDNISNRSQPSNVQGTRAARRKKSSLSKERDPNDLQYLVDETPPWYLCIFLGFQHYLVMFGATVANPLYLAPYLCIDVNDSEAKSELINTILFCSGIITLLQCTLGSRLPIVQGGSFTFIAPSIAILTLDQWKCSSGNDEAVAHTTTSVPLAAEYSLMANVTCNGSSSDCGFDDRWKYRIREIQGAIMIASLFQVVIGFSGLLGLFLKFIGPLTVAPTIALAGLALFDVASYYASKQWWITLITVVLIAMFSQYTKAINIPCCQYQKGVGLVRRSFPLFRLFPIILAIALTWLICIICTVSGWIPDGFSAWGYENGTDLSLNVLKSAPWFRVPYPGQWGVPTFSTASVFGMLSGVLASLVECIGDYYACARISDAPPPPMHAVNRGIGMGGIGCLIAGAFGSGSGTTSYGENIGAIGITKVASRRVIQVAAIFMILCGVFGKFGALFVTIPVPVVGGVFIVMFGMIAAVGMSNLQFVDLNSSRNLFIIGFSFFFGLSLPKYISSQSHVLVTGNQAFDQITQVLLSTSMFVGGLSGFILDNTIPGTKEERGLVKWRQLLIKNKSNKSRKRREYEESIYIKQQTIYEIPYITEYLRRFTVAKYIPFLPTFDENLLMFHTEKWCGFCVKKDEVDGPKIEGDEGKYYSRRNEDRDDDIEAQHSHEQDTAF